MDPVTRNDAISVSSSNDTWATDDPKIPGSEGAHVLSYIDVLMATKAVGPRVAIVGAGGHRLRRG